MTYSVSQIGTYVNGKSFPGSGCLHHFVLTFSSISKHLFTHLNDRSSSLSDDNCMGVFLPVLYLELTVGPAAPPARNLANNKKRSLKPQLLSYTYFKKCCRGERRMSIVERRLHD